MRAAVSGPDGKGDRALHGFVQHWPLPVLAAAIIEAGHDDNGIIWPEQVAPFHVGVADLKVGDAETGRVCSELERQFENAGLDATFLVIATNVRARSSPRST